MEPLRLIVCLWKFWNWTRESSAFIFRIFRWVYSLVFLLSKRFMCYPYTKITLLTLLKKISIYFGNSSSFRIDLHEKKIFHFECFFHQVQSGFHLSFVEFLILITTNSLYLHIQNWLLMKIEAALRNSKAHSQSKRIKEEGIGNDDKNNKIRRYKVNSVGSSLSLKPIHNDKYNNKWGIWRLKGSMKIYQSIKHNTK